MVAITFDSHYYVKRLRDEGITEKQAEALIEVVREVKLSESDEIAKKSDLRELELRLDGRFKDVYAATKDMQPKIGAMIFALGGFLAAIKYFG